MRYENGIFEVKCLLDPETKPDLVYSRNLHDAQVIFRRFSDPINDIYELLTDTWSLQDNILNFSFFKVPCIFDGNYIFIKSLYLFPEDKEIPIFMKYKFSSKKKESKEDLHSYEKSLYEDFSS